MDLIARLRDVVTPNRPLADPTAFAQFYEQSYAVVFRYVYMLHGGSHPEVEDCAADAFTRAWSHRHRFTGSDDAALGWILTIARRIVIDHHRRQKSARTARDQAPRMPSTPEQLALVRERDQMVLDLLSCVSLAQREQLILRYFLDWRVQDIATHLGMSAGAVSVSLHRALRTLQSKYAVLTEDLFHDA